MKKAICIIVLFLAACGGGGDDDTAPTEKINDPAPPASAPARG